MVEDFSYFTLLHQPGFNPTTSTPSTDATTAGAPDVEKDETTGDKAHQQAKAKEREAPLPPREGASSLFGIACTRQIRSDRLKKRSKSVTRSSVQKSVVVIVSGVAGLGELRTRLGMVVEMWFGKSPSYLLELTRMLYYCWVRLLTDREPQHKRISPTRRSYKDSKTV
jgi:hypothetical protein